MDKNTQTIAYGPQPSQKDEHPHRLLGLAAGIGGVAGLGFVRTGDNSRVWDHYLRGIRTAETTFPGAILRTFRISETLSPLETWSNVSVPDQHFALAGKYSEALRNQFGNISNVSMSRTGSVFGEVSSDGSSIGVGLRIKAGTQKGNAIADYYARITGTSLSLSGVGGALRTESLNEDLLRAQYRLIRPNMRFQDWVMSLDPSERFNDLIIGAKYRNSITFMGYTMMLNDKLRRLVARAEVTTQLMRARAATTVGRLNNLLSKPLEIPLIGDILNKVPLIRSMAVEPGSAMQMASRYAWKGMAVGMAWKGLEYYDYLRSQGGPASSLIGTAGGAAIGGLLFKRAGAKVSTTGLLVGAGVGLFTAMSPRFDEGLFYGFASIFSDANIIKAKASQATGLTESLQNQDRISPDLISLPTALGFVGVGGLIGGFAQYTNLLKNSISTRVTTGGNMANIIDRAREKVSANFGSELWESSIGKRIASLPGGKFLSEHIKSPVVLGAAIGLGAWGLLSTGTSLLSGNIGAAIPGVNLLGSEETPEELQAIYSGEQEVAIRKGRWWEAGRSSLYRGGAIDYYRPHFMARLKSRAYQKGLYGDESEKWEYDPMLHPLNALFGSDEWKYHYEIKHQYDRPAPLSSTYGENIPFIGPAVVSTFGRMFKPRKLIRPEEWNYGNGKYAYLEDIRGENEPAYDLGGIGPGAPVSPEEGTQLLNELAYRRREAVGLVGFGESVIQKAITGREETFKNLQTIGSMGEETSSEYWLWKHMNLGGALGSSEGIRRFIPHDRNYLDTYNPLANNLPSWIPNDYFMDLKHGNPYDKISEAEIRLPGSGFETLHPELQGISPENYPLAYRVKILGDIAMYSKEYEHALKQAKSNLRYMSDTEQSLVLQTESQVKSRKNSKREINEYRFRPELLSAENVTVTNILDPRHVQTKEYGEAILELQGFGAVKDIAKAMEFAKEHLTGSIQIQVPTNESDKFKLGKNYSFVKAVAMLDDVDYGTAISNAGLAENADLEDSFQQIRFSPRERLAGSITETIMHNIETPLEMLTPISPAAKLIRKRSALEEYIATQAVGTGNAFWDRPVENFLKPALDTTLYKTGLGSIPESVERRREINEYFDMIKWVKSKHAESIAYNIGDKQRVIAEREKQQETLFGIDVFGAPMKIMKALPRAERDFYKYFSEAKTEEEKQKILAVIPSNERRVYQAAWAKQAEQVAIARSNAKIATQEDNETIIQVQKMRKTEGFGEDNLEQQWIRETNRNIPFDEWIRNKKAAEYFATHSLPGPDWLGWHPSCDLDDIKLKYVQMEGLDSHDFDLWDSRARSLARKPYINEDLINAMSARSNIQDMMKTKTNANTLAKIYGDNARMSMSYIDAPIKERYDIEIRDSREDLVNKSYKQLGAR